MFQIRDDQLLSYKLEEVFLIQSCVQVTCILSLIIKRIQVIIYNLKVLVYWSSFLVLWTILELSIEFYMYFHKLSRQTPPHQVADSQ